VVTDGASHRLDRYEALYIGMGTKEVAFEPEAGSAPKFYLLSCPAHCAWPTTLITREMAVKQALGSKKECNERVINKYVHPDVVKSCQLSMGMTELEEGSVWNTMPTHTHERRMEVYMYFNLPEDGVVFHFMGQPPNCATSLSAAARRLFPELVHPFRGRKHQLQLRLGHGGRKPDLFRHGRRSHVPAPLAEGRAGPPWKDWMPSRRAWNGGCSSFSLRSW
jgi:hypothetical protein